MLSVSRFCSVASAVKFGHHLSGRLGRCAPVPQISGRRHLNIPDNALRCCRPTRRTVVRVLSSKAQAWIRNWLLVISSGERVRINALRSRASCIRSTCNFSKTPKHTVVLLAAGVNQVFGLLEQLEGKLNSRIFSLPEAAAMISSDRSSTWRARDVIFRSRAPNSRNSSSMAAVKLNSAFFSASNPSAELAYPARPAGRSQGVSGSATPPADVLDDKLLASDDDHRPPTASSR